MAYRGMAYRAPDFNFPDDFYLDDVGVWRLKKEKLAELENPRPQTNEAWFCSLSTEEKAEWLETIMRLSGTCEFIGGCFKCPLQPCGDIVDFERQIWLAWLKEKHE